MMKILFFLTTAFLLAPFLGFGQTTVSGDIQTVSWNDHFTASNRSGDIGPGNLIVASDTSEVRVATLPYANDKSVDIYYPPDYQQGELRGAVIMVSGDSDSHVRNWYGRSLSDTNQYLQWGQMIAEQGMIAVTYELQNPQLALNTIVSWIEQNNDNLGIDSEKLGFFCTSENGCATGLETIVIDSRKYDGPKPAFAVFYYGMLPLYSSKDIYLDVPILTVQTRDYMYRGIPESMQKFNRRAQDEGALLTAVEYEDGECWFDCRNDTNRSREIVQTTLSFMLNGIGNS
jgi:hypothetical protein